MTPKFILFITHRLSSFYNANWEGNCSYGIELEMLIYRLVS